MGSSVRHGYRVGPILKIIIGTILALFIYSGHSNSRSLHGFGVHSDKPGNQGANSPCPIPEPIKTVSGVKYYIDQKGSVSDPKLVEMNNQRTEKLKSFVTKMGELGDQAAGVDGHVSFDCAAKILEHWAAAGAILDAEPYQGTYERNVAVTGIALAVLKLEASKVWGEREIDSSIGHWLSALSGQMTTVLENELSHGRWENLDSWYSLAVMAVSIDIDDRQMFTRSLVFARFALEQISSNGLLPSELKRGSRALEYHYFALTPLVMMAELCAVNGIDLYNENSHGLERLASHLINASRDPNEFLLLTGDKQNTTVPSGAGLAWAVPYTLRFPGRVPADWLAGRTMFFEWRLGGDLLTFFRR